MGERFEKTDPVIDAMLEVLHENGVVHPKDLDVLEGFLRKGVGFQMKQPSTERR